MVIEHFDVRSPKDLFKKYLRDFEKIGIDWNQDWKEWTRRNLGYFSELGKTYKYVVYWSGLPDNGEYLVDLCWNVESNEYFWLEVAVEEEWKPKWDDIAWDFSKLADIKAYLKIFVCFPEESIRSDLPFLLATFISRHRIKIPEEEYLVVIFSRDRRRKQSERLLVEGFSIDYRGNVAPLEHKYFPDSLADGT